MYPVLPWHIQVSYITVRVPENPNAPSGLFSTPAIIPSITSLYLSGADFFKSSTLLRQFLEVLFESELPATQKAFLLSGLRPKILGLQAICEGSAQANLFSSV